MPSILDGLPKSETDVKEIHLRTAAALGGFIEQSAWTPRGRGVVEALAEGLSPADILGITGPQRDALLIQGVRQLQQGDAAGAQNTLTQLHHLEPTDERVIYALATAYQSQQNYVTAGRLYLGFLALDATNPQGYLRLGECFLGNGETDQALAYFEAAKVQAAGTADQEAVDPYADSMLAALAARGAAA